MRGINSFSILEEYISLSELNSLIKAEIDAGFPGTYRITAEISELRESRGHAYLELSEKSDKDLVKAKARATIWASTYGMLKSYFESSTGHRFEAGLKVLLLVKVVFHEVYGFSLNIVDIDPTYTLGEIERKRLMIIRRLEEEGVMNMNKELDFPLVPQRIAVISSDTAAGFGDFKNQLAKSPFRFEYTLFNAVMQGEETENSVVNALDRIYEEEEKFDLVVLIRGGGAKSDLSWFDSYKTAVHIAQFPLPVLTGIGHERDFSVSDMTAHRSLNTPTAVAEFLIDALSEFYTYFETTAESVFAFAENMLREKKNKIAEISTKVNYVFRQHISDKNNVLKLLQAEAAALVQKRIANNVILLQQYPYKLTNVVHEALNRKMQMNTLYELRIKNALKSRFEKEKHKLAIWEQKMQLSDPQNVLKSGYSYTLHKGKIVKSVKNIQNNDILETVLSDGKVKSKVIK